MFLFFQLLEEDIAKHEDKMKTLTKMADNFRARKHFLSNDMCARAHKLMERYDAKDLKMVIVITVMHFCSKGID